MCHLIKWVIVILKWAQLYMHYSYVCNKKDNCGQFYSKHYSQLNNQKGLIINIV